MADESVTDDLVQDTAAEVAAPAPADSAGVTPEVTEAPSKGFITMIEDAAVAVGEEIEEDLAKVWEFLSETTKAEIALGRATMKKLTGK